MTGDGTSYVAIKVGAGKAHSVAGRTSSGGYLTICGMEFKDTRPHLRETSILIVPIGDQCIPCWSH